MTDWAPIPPDRGSGIAGAYRAACHLELRALKPGNVHIHADGHGMTVSQFLASADATAPILARPGLSVGERIFEAVAATRAAVGCNTNLGILLLAAPLAQAALTGGGPLRDRLGRVLADLTVEDAELTFRAIALAEPAGLGRVEGADVHAPATVTLLAAMREAQDRDRIARQYATDFADLFETGVPRLRYWLKAAASYEEATERLYLFFLSTVLDSHVARKYGLERAEWLRGRASELSENVAPDRAFTLTRSRLGELDRELKYNGVNPGTTADIVVGCLLAHWLMQSP
ncbi:triphosphoribosyl-dephospho-CoA synthase [Azospirillum rugosum]|uniref:Triphosphoribosyl-dephospho-CoA synthase n=1 Tax=Azospirillum rugosum TaxID=416170 RepID=A0ABS4SVP1_9PROT|nr:triphosphoribosyl-dephospho-CoA synthase [Azospirillum rugosum]MBP2296284.1 triphosphoribosyl-dephospho-CoA synthase [Azospirillum rugosum]MDQ0529805.1 triphosphoribosyl-dephospho-CoA synthase [Azospirillum rugosum]